MADVVDTVTLARAEYVALARDAECWRAVARSGDVTALLSTWANYLNSGDAPTTGAMTQADWRAACDAAVAASAEEHRRRMAPKWTPVCQIREQETGYMCGRVLEALPYKPTGNERCGRAVVSDDESGRFVHPPPVRKKIGERS